MGNVSVIEVEDRPGIEIVDLDRKLLCEMSIYTQYNVLETLYPYMMMSEEMGGLCSA